MGAAVVVWVGVGEWEGAGCWDWLAAGQQSCLFSRDVVWHGSQPELPSPPTCHPKQLLMTSLETASDSLRRQAGERDEAEAAGQVRLATCGAVGQRQGQAGAARRAFASCRCSPSQCLLTGRRAHPSPCHLCSSPSLCRRPTTPCLS